MIKYLMPAGVVFFGMVANALAGATAKDCPECEPKAAPSCAGVRYAVVEAPRAGCSGAPQFVAPAVRSGGCAGSRYSLGERRAAGRAARANARATRSMFAAAARQGAVQPAALAVPSLSVVQVQEAPAPACCPKGCCGKCSK